MAWTNYAKNALMDTEQFDANSKYIALAVGGTELTGSGYSRAEWTTAQMTIANDGTITGPEITIYTASGASAVQATQTGIFDAATTGNQWLEWETITSPPAAPVDGQDFRLTPTVTP